MPTDSGSGAHPRKTGEDRLPGDPSPEQIVERIIRVDQAGEYGALRVYEGQLAVLGDKAGAKVIHKMAAKEEEHLAVFDRLMVERRVRPTLLSPLWHVAGYALGAATALLGKNAAMACTQAVEEVIDEHYARQAAKLGEDEAKLRETIEEFRRDELAHRDAALAHGALDAPAHGLLIAAIKAGSRLAIRLSARI
jgi:ubiquinone biosynthesis monooxygenase Coq7